MRYKSTAYKMPSIALLLTNWLARCHCHKQAAACLLLLACVALHAQQTGICHGQDAFSGGGVGLCDATPWCLVFEDDFNGISLDESKWTVAEGVPRGLDDPNLMMWYSANNISVSNGYLSLTARYEPGLHTYVSNWDTNPWSYTTKQFHYTSAEINSLYRFGEGLYVARCRIPVGHGYFFPAFWLYGQEGPSSNSNEIDVFEFWGNDSEEWHISYHKHNSLHCGVSYTGNNATEWREYALEWERFGATWSRDDLGIVRYVPRWLTILGQPLTCNSIPGGLKLLNTGYPNHPPVASNIIFNLAIQHHEPLQPNILGTLPVSYYPGSLEIDYIRYYRRVPCLGELVLQQPSSYMSPNGEYNLLTATSVVTGTNLPVLISPQSQIDMRATNFILLNPGFLADHGSVFRAMLGSSNCGVVLMHPGSHEPEDDFHVSDSSIGSLDMPSGLSNRDEGNPNEASSDSSATNPSSWIVYNMLGERIAESGNADFITKLALTPGPYILQRMSQAGIEHVKKILILP